MVKHGALSRSHVYRMLASKDARVRRAAFALLEASNPALRKNSELFMEIVRFIWDANPSYEVHELIAARLQIERRRQQCARADRRAEDARRYEGGFFRRLLRAIHFRRERSGPVARAQAVPHERRMV
jgi:hypothetical protein